jgi:hypothetical protein
MAGKPHPHRQAFDDLGITMFEDLPHDRADAVGLHGLDLADLRAPTEEEESKYWNLIKFLESEGEPLPDYRTLRAALVQYVMHAVAFPKELQGYWTLSALSRIAGADRLFTLSVRGTEVFTAPFDPFYAFGMVLADRKGLRKQLEDHGVSREEIKPAPYAALRELKSIRFFCSFESAWSLIQDQQILDDAYAVCREHMIHGKRGLNWKSHNAAFASDVLLTGYRS